MTFLSINIRKNNNISMYTIIHKQISIKIIMQQSSISPRSITISKIIIDINYVLQKYNVTDDFTMIDHSNLFYITTYKNTTNNLEVTHCEINSQSVTYTNFITYKKNYETLLCHITHHILMKYFNNTNANIFIMTDFFIINDIKQIVDTHTITLYKHFSNDLEINIIDPNNFTYSKNFVTSIGDSHIFTLKILEYKQEKLYSNINDKDCIKINDESILKPDYDSQFFIQRDCTDISLKICYELYELIKIFGLNPIDQLTNELIKHITNQKINNDDIHKYIDGTLLRSIHSSDNTERTNAQNKLKENKKFIQNFGSCNPHIRKDSLENINQVRQKIESFEKDIKNNNGYTLNFLK